MQVNIKILEGNWAEGLAMDKHMLWARPDGHTQSGHIHWDKERTQVGEAVYRLKYKFDWDQVQPLASCLKDNAIPLFDNIGFIVPMPATKVRDRQPVTAIAQALAKMIDKPCFEGLLIKAPGGVSLKDLQTKEQKIAAIGDSFSINPLISNNGCWNVLVIDDLFHTGASMEAACMALRGYDKVGRIYVASLTWR